MAAFSSRDGGKIVRGLYEADAQSFIDVIDEARSTPTHRSETPGSHLTLTYSAHQALLDLVDLSPPTRRECLKSLYRACGRHALLPTAMKVLAQYDRTGGPLCRGGFADVWKGDYCGREVAVKVMRTYTRSDLQKVVGVSRWLYDPPTSELTSSVQRFCKEVVTWRTLRHPNVLSLIGVMMNESQFAMISDWMENGNINEFIRANPDADQLGLVSFSLEVSPRPLLMQLPSWKMSPGG